jgi:3D (Asp-Asp-Asp) domain-containing protein
MKKKDAKLHKILHLAFTVVIVLVTSWPAAASDTGDDIWYAQALSLSRRINRLTFETAAMNEELKILADLHQLQAYFNTQEILSDFDRHPPVTASLLLQRYRAYNRRTTMDDLIKKYGDVFGRNFTSSTTAYIIQGRTRSGRFTRPGTVAVNPQVIPLGTRLYSLHFGMVFRADDTGGGIMGSSIDVFLNDTEANARIWGRRNTEWVLLDNNKIRIQREHMTDIVSKYTGDLDTALQLLNRGKAAVVNVLVDSTPYGLSPEAMDKITAAFLTN